MEKERYWTFVAYPESLPENWKDILQETGLQIGISPLHDKDLNADGEIKKPHYHLIVCFPGPTTYNRVTKITEQLKATIPKRVMSVIGIVRYFTHKDNPEKHQYDPSEIQSINGFDPNNFDGITITMQQEIKKGIIQLIRGVGIKEYKDLVDYTIDNEMYDMFTVVSQNTIFFNYYLTSYRNSIKMQLEENIKKSNLKTS